MLTAREQAAFEPTQMPRVSVLMTTYNGSRFIAASIDSIIAQTYRDFELLIVDDMSTDNTPEILASYTDERIRVLRPPHNMGIVGARNFGFAACRGEFLAALDHDDLSAPDRLEQQVAFLDANPSIVMVGSAVELIDNDVVRPKYEARGITPFLLRWMLFVSNPFTYSSVMLRADAVRGLAVYMRAEYELADDFDLYHRLLNLGDLARLAAVLTTYRSHINNTTHKHAHRQSALAAEILANAYAKWLGDDAQPASELVVELLVNSQSPRDCDVLERLADILLRLLAGFCNDRKLNGAERAEVAANASLLWWRAARGAIRSGVPGAVAAFRNRPALLSGFQPGRADWLASCTVGALRANGVTRRLLAQVGR
jgi:GT2 family glycosyltransferase